MRKKKKVLPLLMAGSLLLGSLAGCTNSGSNAGEDKNTSANADSQTEEGELNPVTLHFYFFDNKKAETDHVWEEIADYVNEKYNLNVSFDIQFIAGTDYKDKMLVKSSAGDKWDLNFEGDWISYYQMINKDAYMDLDELLPKYAPKLYETYQDTNVLEAAKSKGNIVALPWTMRMTQRPLFQWRGDLAEEAGIDVDPTSIKTVEDVDKLLGQLKKAYPDRYIVENSAIQPFVIQENLVVLNKSFVVRLDDPELKVMPLEQTDAYRSMVKYAQKWQEAGYIWKDVLTDKLDHNQLIDQGRLITKWGAYENARTNRAWVEDGAYWDYNVLYEDNLWANRTPLANCLCIPKTAENPERTLMFLELVHTDQELYDMVHYGLEGLTYELDGEQAVYPEGMNGANSNYMDWGGRWALWDPNFMRPDDMYKQDFWVEEAEFVDSNDKNVISPLEGFNFDTESVQTEMTQLIQIFDEAHKMLEVGLAGDYETALDKLISDRKAAGLDQVLEEFQRQIDEFIKE